MAVLPDNVTYGHVIGRFLVDAPTDVPATGKVRFVPAAAHLQNIQSTPPTTIVLESVICDLDAEGDVVDSTGAKGVDLVATDNADISPVNWTWAVQISIAGRAVSKFNMGLPGGETVDLAAVIPLSADSGDPPTVIVGPAGPPGSGGGGSSGPVTLTEDPADSDLYYGMSGLTEDPADSGLYTVTDTLTEDPADTDLYYLTGTGGGGGSGATGPEGPPGATGEQGLPGADGVGVPTGGTTDQVLAKLSDTDHDTGWVDAAEGGVGAGVTDGDKGDIVVSDTGATWMLDSGVVTTAAKTVLDDATTTDMRTTLGLGNVDNTADADKPVSTATTTALTAKADAATTTTALAGKVATTTTISTTAPLTGGGDLSTNRTLAISDFTSSTKGAVPSPVSSSGRFLKDDGTWDSPASVISGAGGVFPFMLSSTATEPPTGSQLRGNNATFSSSTKLWIMETTVDGLDITVGLGRIKAGFQVYVQDYDNAAVYAVFNVTADATDSGGYWEVSVAVASFSGTIPAGKIAIQSLSSAQAGNLFSTTTSAKGLAPGSSGGGASVWLNGAAGWTAPTKTTVGLANVDNTSDATKDAATATLTNKTLTDAKVNLAVNAQTAAYTLVLTDNSKVVTLSNASSLTLSVPTNASVAFPTGTQITLIQIGAGQVTVAAVTPGTTTVNGTPGLKLRAQYSAASLVKTGTDQWYLMGDLSA